MKKVMLSLLFVSFIVSLFATEWIEVSPPEGHIGSMSYHFISSNEGWAFSTYDEQTELYHTIDTGQNWELIYESDRYRMEELQMIDSENGWAMLYGNSTTNLFTTINGGEDWYRVTIQLPILNHVEAIKFSDSMNGLISGGTGYETYLYRTTNGCYDFENLFQLNETYLATEINCIGEDNIWVSGGFLNGIAIHSNNGGVDWELLGTSISVANTRSSHFLTDQVYGFTGYFTIDGEFLSNVLILTNDNMDTYTVYGRATFEERVYSCYFMDEQTIWVGGQKHMFISYDGGATFSTFQDFGSYVTIKSITFIDSTGFATGANGSLYVYSPTVNNEELTVSKPNLKLDNYPNPFNPETTISFSNPQAGKVNLSIYNLKGQLVRKLLDDEVAEGAHSVVWNGKDARGKSVASGIYFTKIKTEAGVKTKKMLMMK